MAPRPYWKGFLKLSLVSCPIALYTATSPTERVSFRQINKKTGNRLRQQLVDEVTRQPVEAQDKGRGYEVDKDQYLPVEDNELEAIQIESTHTISIDKFVPRAQIDRRYFDTPYYIAPNDDVGEEAFSVIREAMKSDDMVGLGRVVLSKRERVIAIEASGLGLIGTTLRYPYEVRNEADYFSDIKPIKIDKEMLGLAKHLIETKAGDFYPGEMNDTYETALVDLLKKKQKGFVPRAGRIERPNNRNVVNLMDALRKSVSENKGEKKKRGRAA
jgi:DNA end-binding protein Ku